MFVTGNGGNACIDSIDEFIIFISLYCVKKLQKKQKYKIFSCKER